MPINRNLSVIADRLIAAHDAATMLAPITSSTPSFSVADAYAVLGEIERRRRAQGWQPVGRKIGFTNRTIWPRYGVWQPIWAHMWAHTVQFAPNGRASLALRPFVQPRIEPEVVFGLKASVPVTEDPLVVLSCIEWMAPGFEIVQCHYPEWRFSCADCTAAFGLHGALVVGAPQVIGATEQAALAMLLSRFVLTLRRGATVIDRGIGENVLGSPALALAHLTRVLAQEPQFPALAAGEIITTGTLTDAWSIAPGEIWSSDYGALGLAGLTLELGP
jgi:2-oxo-3-hexenedioate decarboxylase